MVKSPEIKRSLDFFHPSLRLWFIRHFNEPTEVQEKAWESIRKGIDTLIAAPTGSGKTLAGFFWAINSLLTEGQKNSLPDETRVLYISPLKALSNDIHRNLEVPLSGIREELRKTGVVPPEIRVSVRTGDTKPGERQKQLKRPPHIFITTPESLYILLTSEGGRKILSTVSTVIIDEIHAVVADKRGAHLSLSLERLKNLVKHPIQRIGISATQKPIETVYHFLTGTSGCSSSAGIIDLGHQRKLDISLEIPDSPLTAVMANEVWDEIYEKILGLSDTHATTLIFVNTRKLAERLAHNLGEKLGKDKVSSHHGSMSRHHRHSAEQRLKAGNLKVLVATASMELGIDIGSVELVIQIGSPRSISGFLQRIGRSRHQVGAIPKGVIFPLTRDELVECTALVHAARQGKLDLLEIPEKPFDILAQQIVAETSLQEYGTDDLYRLIISSYIYKDLSKKEFQQVIQMLAEGFSTRRGRKGAYLYYDPINEKIRGRKGAKLTALTSGGAIPDNFDYEVVLDPEDTVIGTLNEDFALESAPGDVFILGNHSWMVLRVDGLKVRVKDAGGLPPSVPFWLGEGRGRSFQLSEAVSELRKKANEILDSGQETLDQWLQEEMGLSVPAANQLTQYLAAGKNALGVIPSMDTIVMERFFDEAGDMHLVIHSSYGSRVNKGWGLALRKKFCRTFNFELQAAANEDSIVISLGSVHSFPLEEVFRYLHTNTLKNTLTQAMLDAPLFEIRWRWNASRALAIVKSRGGKRTPPQLQRMQAEDLVAQVFPDQIACLENIAGDREIPDHPLITETIRDCLHEAMDYNRLEALIGKIQRKEIRLLAIDLREPSPFAQEIINARPYQFLDDTPFEERRVNAVRSRRWLDPSDAEHLSRLDPEAIRQVREEAWPLAETADELSDALQVHAFVTRDEIKTNNWSELAEKLLSDNRAAWLYPDQSSSPYLLLAAERIPLFRALYPKGRLLPDIILPESITGQKWDERTALKEAVRGRLEASGPVTSDNLSDLLALPKQEIENALIALEQEGFVFRGKFHPEATDTEWCERRLLHRINRYTLETLRQAVQPVSLQDYMRYLFHLNGINKDRTGPAVLQEAMEILDGYEAPAVSWEADILPLRVTEYDPTWLDVLTMSGRIIWGRLDKVAKSGLSPVKTTPITLVSRKNMDLWNSIKKPTNTSSGLSPTTLSVLLTLKNGGALFLDDLAEKTGLLNTQLEQAIAELVAAGLITCDSFSGLRALLTPEKNKLKKSRRPNSFTLTLENAGRWSNMPAPSQPEETVSEEHMVQFIHIYLRRYGVIFRKVLERENVALPWREIVKTLRRMELKGELRGGRFIAGTSGEQYALPETIEALRKVRKTEKTEDLVAVSAVDPCNLLGIVLPGKKVSNSPGNRILYMDGVPVAVYEAKEVRFLKEFSPEKKWALEKAIIRRSFPGKLKGYMGKSYV